MVEKTRKIGNNLAIDDVGVKKDYQKRGIASRLTDLVLGAEIEEGAESVNALAQPEYGKILERKGFESDGFFSRIILGKK